MRGGAIDVTVLQGLPNATFQCGSIKFDQAAASLKTEACNDIYQAVRGVGAGGRQAAIRARVQAAVAAAGAAGGAAATPAQTYLSTHQDYVGLYKYNGYYYTVPINKAPGTVASDPNPGAAAGAAPAR